MTVWKVLPKVKSCFSYVKYRSERVFRPSDYFLFVFVVGWRFWLRSLLRTMKLLVDKGMGAQWHIPFIWYALPTPVVVFYTTYSSCSGGMSFVGPFNLLTVISAFQACWKWLFSRTFFWHKSTHNKYVCKVPHRAGIQSPLHELRNQRKFTWGWPEDHTTCRLECLMWSGVKLQWHHRESTHR